MKLEPVAAEARDQLDMLADLRLVLDIDAPGGRIRVGSGRPPDGAVAEEYRRQFVGLVDRHENPLDRPRGIEKPLLAVGEGVLPTEVDARQHRVGDRPGLDSPTKSFWTNSASRLVPD